ncbi:MAG: dockerin type I repeat-containing protein, partial [Clostridia bacterium]|nr:dockerin type I repeat-containing protein [Clostridia bacterium]
LIFRIPVFKSMPSKPYAKPEVSDNYNNFYILDFKVDGLNTAFDKYKYNYSFSVSGDKSVFVKLHGNAKLQKTSYNLSAGTNVINVTVIAETGYTKTYDFSVKAEKAGTLTLVTEEIVPPQEPQDPQGQGTQEPEEPEEPEEPQQDDPQDDPKRKKGDTNGDGLIDIMDFALIRLHILGKKTITSTDFQYYDIDGSGIIDIMDFALVRLHILGKKTIN